jgi:hypothetical protein
MNEKQNKINDAVSRQPGYAKGFLEQNEGITPTHYDFYENKSQKTYAEEGINAVRVGFLKALDGEVGFNNVRQEILLLLEGTETEMTAEDCKMLREDPDMILELVNMLDDDYDLGNDLSEDIDETE